jgi:hypothetical protein
MKRPERSPRGRGSLAQRLVNAIIDAFVMLTGVGLTALSVGLLIYNLRAGRDLVDTVVPAIVSLCLVAFGLVIAASWPARILRESAGRWYATVAGVLLSAAYIAFLLSFAVFLFYHAAVDRGTPLYQSAFYVVVGLGAVGLAAWLMRPRRKQRAKRKDEAGR